MTLFLAGIAATVGFLALALVVQDVVFYFRGHNGVTTRFVRRHTPRGRVVRLPVSRIKVKTERAS